MNTDFRHEYKYLLDACDYSVLLTRVSCLLPRDPYAGADGKYLVKSLYFDDFQDSCFYENEDGTDNRTKFRIRFYNNDYSVFFLEKKVKQNGMTKKLITAITKEQCEQFIRGEIPTADDSLDPVAVSLFTEMRLRSMRPRVIVSYERTPFVYAPGNVRITFDNNLESSDDVAGFLTPQSVSRPVFYKGNSLLEVKWDEVLPQFIKKQLGLNTLQWTSFSKYYLCRLFSIYGGV